MLSKKTVLAVLTLMILIIGTVYALKIFGQIMMSYRIMPAAEAPSLKPNPIELDLGTIPSGSTGLRDFEKVGTLTSPAGYKITFELNTTTAEDFEVLEVTIRFYKEGVYVGYVGLSLEFPSDSITLDSGIYDLHIEVKYTAKSLTSERTGTIIVYAMWPG